MNFDRLCLAERKELESIIINGVNVKIPELTPMFFILLARRKAFLIEYPYQRPNCQLAYVEQYSKKPKQTSHRFFRQGNHLEEKAVKGYEFLLYQAVAGRDVFFHRDSCQLADIVVSVLGKSLAEFSHSVCPDCFARLYPDLDNAGR